MLRFTQAAIGTNPTGTTFIVNENFEGTGAPSGFTTTGGTTAPDWDYTASPLSGSQSVYFATVSVAHKMTCTIADMSELWIYFLMKFTNGSAPASQKTIGNIFSSASAGFNFVVNTNMRIALGTPSPVTAISFDQLYHVWMHYRQGTGANAAIDIGFSTDGVRPTSGNNYAAITNSSQTILVGLVLLGSALTTLNFDMVIDNFKIAASQIGDNGT